MSTLARTLVLLSVLTSGLVGCDSSSELEGCVYADDPVAASGSRRDQCLRSTFTAEDFRSREVAGVVRRGEDVVPGAVVRVEPWASLSTGKTSIVASTVTDAVGVFGLRPVPLRYDMLVRFGADAAGRDDVMVYRGVGGRYIEPSLEGESRTFPRSWSGRVDVRLSAEVPEGHVVAFFASGEGVFGVTGDLTTGLSVHGSQYVTPATIHAVEYDKTGGLETATAYGKVDVLADAGAARLAAIHLDPITVFARPKFAVTAPAGFPAASTVDVIIGFTRTSDARLATVPVGVSTKLPVIPNAGYTYRARSTLDGAISDSGETGLDVYAPETLIELPNPPAVEWPIVGGARGVGEPLLASGEGVLEHVLVPEVAGPRIRMITRQRDAVLPDVRALGAAPTTGAYTWTVRSFPALRFAEELSGVDSRRYRAMGASQPRSIVLR